MPSGPWVFTPSSPSLTVADLRLDTNTLDVLARFKEVIVAVDADGPGDAFAAKLAGR